jgi:hypothetical protein
MFNFYEPWTHAFAYGSHAFITHAIFLLLIPNVVNINVFDLAQYGQYFSKIYRFGIKFKLRLSNAKYGNKSLYL